MNGEWLALGTVAALAAASAVKGGSASRSGLPNRVGTFTDRRYLGRDGLVTETERPVLALPGGQAVVWAADAPYMADRLLGDGDWEVILQDQTEFGTIRNPTLGSVVGLILASLDGQEDGWWKKAAYNSQGSLNEINYVQTFKDDEGQALLVGMRFAVADLKDVKYTDERLTEARGARRRAKWREGF